MTVYDPAIYRTVVAENGGNNRKFHSINKLLIDMAAAGMIGLEVGDNPPSDTTIIWLDLTLPENGNGQAKVYEGGNWVALTPEYFILHYGASTQAAEDAATAAAASAAEASGYKDLTAADALATAADVVSAEAAKSGAEAAQTAAENAQAATEQIRDNYQSFLLAPKASDPIVDDNGDPLTNGDMYANTATESLRVIFSGVWKNYTGATGIANLVEDTTPQLGGNLDLNSFSVGAASAADLTKLNALTATATELNYVDGVTSDIQTQINGKQPLDALLASIAALTFGSNNYIYGTGSDTAAVGTITSVARTLVAQTTQSLMLTAGLGLSANGQSLVTAADYAAMRTLLGLVIGTNVQAYDAGLQSWAGVTRASGFDTFAATPSSANLRALLTDEVGTGAAYFVGGALGTPASGTLSSCSGLPASGVTNTALVVSVENQGSLTGGANVTPKALGTITTGTVTVDVGDRAMQSYTNNGAHALAVDTGGTGTTTVLITNGASAGAITTSSFDLVLGDPFDTVNGSKFLCWIFRFDASNEILFVQKTV